MLNRSYSRARLCRWGPKHRMRKCAYAHSLSELSLAPPKYSRFCQTKADRWIGQPITEKQWKLFLVYWDEASQMFMSLSFILALSGFWCQAQSYERPTWAKALHWFNTDDDLCGFPDCPWDFDLWGDSTPYWKVFDHNKELWIRLKNRYTELSKLWKT